MRKAEPRSSAKRRPVESRRGTRSRRFVYALILFIAAIVLVDALVGDQGLIAMLRARHEYDELVATIAQQRTENARLRDVARRLREDPATIEEVARRELGLMKPGEKLFILKDIPPPKH